MHNKRYSTDISFPPPTNSGSNIISHLTYFKSHMAESPAPHLSPRHLSTPSPLPKLFSNTQLWLHHLPALKPLTAIACFTGSSPYFLAWHARCFAIWLSPPCHCTQKPSTICSSNNTPNMTCTSMPPSLCSWCCLRRKALTLFPT